MLEFTPVSNDREIREILENQRKNLLDNLSKDEVEKQGFVTVVHNFNLLKKMNLTEPSIVAKDDQRVIGYCLAMTKDFKKDIPVLDEMFERFDNLDYKGKKISIYKYLILGQVCIEKKYRGLRVFDKLYELYRKTHSIKYDILLTQISEQNQRSINAHKRVGFEVLKKYQSANGENWEIIIWDWLKNRKN